VALTETVKGASLELIEALGALTAELASQEDPAVTMLAETLVGGGKILFAGNGGSAAMANHLAAELVVRFLLDRRPYQAISLAADNAVLTAIGNDYGYQNLFARQVEALGRPGDTLVSLSTSGKSPNILHGIMTAKHLGLRTLGLSGAHPMNCDVDIRIQSSTTARIQELHLFVGHLLIEELEKRLPA
jgi:D-sedoheptulose 7-phosphate isomerase